MYAATDALRVISRHTLGPVFKRWPALLYQGHMTDNVVAITPAEAVRAVTNSPELAKNEFTLGVRTFQVVDLAYDDYLRFTTHLTPMLEILFGSLMSTT